MRKVLLTISFCFYCLFLTAQEAKLNTKLKPYNFPKVKIIRDTETIDIHSHNSQTPTWVFNSKIKIKTAKPIINLSNFEKFTLEKETRSFLVEYKIEEPEIIDLYELVRKYCNIDDKNILFSIDDEWQKKPDSVFIAIDVIKHIRLVDSKNYPSVSPTKNNFVIVNIKTVNPPKKEEENDGKPKIYIR